MSEPIRQLSPREREQLKLVTERARRNLDNSDVDLAELVPSIRFQADVCREYFDALRDAFKDDANRQILSDERLVDILLVTINDVRK